MTHLLVDGDIVLYSSSVATEHAVHWNDDVWVLSANLDQARDLARRYLDEVTEKLEATKVTICLSGKGNFRYDLNPNYKSNRKDSRKPIVYPELKQWMLNNYGTVEAPNLEADDLLGILATRTPSAAGAAGSIIVSPDKDMQCIPGKLYRQGELMDISLEQANYFHMLQTLTGDPTDGYPGCPGIGPVSAKKLLAGTPDTWWGSVLQAYQKAGLTEEDALLNARMAYILRDENYVNGEVKLWNP